MGPQFEEQRPVGDGDRMKKPVAGAGPGGRRDLWLNLGLLLVSLAAGLGIGEAYFRFLAPCRLYGVQYQSPQIHFFTYDERLGWRGRPGAQGPFGSIDFLVQVQLDRLGNRSSSQPIVAGKRNVLVLGDSYGWGWGVENPELFSEVMMRGDPGLNVYNLSAPGYGTDQQYLQLVGFLGQRPGEHFDHCVMVLCLDNDFDDIVSDQRYTYPKPRFRLAGDGEGLELGNVPVPRTRASEYARSRQLQQSADISIGWLNHLHSWNRFVAWRRYSGWKSRQDEDAGREGEAGSGAASEEGERERRELMAALLAAARDSCAVRGTRFSVAVIHGRNPGPRLEWLVNVLQTEQIPCQTFDQYGSRWRARSFTIDPHLNAYGHQQLAQSIIALLKNQ
jgi:hypothetical protein